MRAIARPTAAGLRRAACAAFAGALGCALTGQAQDRFEIQVYDSEVAGHLEPGVELHLNYAASGVQAATADGELPTHHLLRTTLEPHLGFFGWGELGGYLQGALRPEGSYDFAGLKLRFKARWPEKLLDGALGLAVNGELSFIPSAYEAARWGSELRFIADLRFGPLYLAVNPILTTDLAGAHAGHPQLEPAARVTLELVPRLSAGLEYHAGLGPLDALAPAGEQSHALYAVGGFAGDFVDLDLGVGRGFGAAEPWVVKAIIGLHPREKEPGSPRPPGPGSANPPPPREALERHVQTNRLPEVR